MTPCPAPDCMRRLLLLLLLLLAIAEPAGASSTWMVRGPDDRPLPESFLRWPADDPGWGTPAGAESAIDFDRHLVVGESGPYRLQIGRQEAPERNLALGENRRRGVSFSLRGGPREAALTGFFLRREERPAGPFDLGLDDPGNRLFGVAGAITPRSRGAATFRLSSAILTGSRAAGGELRQDEAWTVAAEAGVLSKLRLRGEIAGSRRDNGEEGQTGGQAASLQVICSSSFRHPSTGWQLGAEKQIVDPFFASPGNPWLVADRDRVRVFSTLRASTLSLQTSAGRERDNLKDLPLHPTIQTHRYSVALDWSPQARRFPAFVGAPSANFGLTGFQRRDLKDPVRYQGRPTEDSQRKWQVGLNFSRSAWNWGIDGSLSDYFDATDYFADTRTRAVGWQLAARPDERLSIGPAVHLRWTEDLGSGETLEAIGLGFRGNLQIVPGRLRGSWDLGRNQEEYYGRQAFRSTRVSGELLYSWIVPRRGRPGYDLSLHWTWRETDQEAPAPEPLRVFLGLTMVWPTAG